MSRAFCVFLFLMFFSPLELFARVGIFELFPNPSGDDTLGEYIEIRNIGCEVVDISGYILRDLQRQYIFPAGRHIESHTTLRIPYGESSIQLNNSGHEELTFADSGSVTLDHITYDGTQRDDVVISIPLIDEICPIAPPDTGSGTSGTGSSGTGSSGTGTDSGSIFGTGTTGTGVTGTGITGTGGSDTGSGSVGTGSVDTGSVLSGTGGSSVSGMSNSGSLSLQPFLLLSLQYDDTDGNRKIDTLIIEYSLELSGSINVNALGIFSRSGGLSTTKIDTATGYIQSASFSGRFLILKIVEQDLEKDLLHITNTTSSDLRLKTLGHMGFTSVYGQTPPDFLLTSSFSNYQNVSRYSSNIETGTGMVGSGMIALGSGTFLFPEIIPILQSPTNASLSGNTFICIGSNLPCRINLTLEPIFTGGLLMRDYICEVGTGTTVLIDCNPNTLHFTSSGILMIRLREKLHPEHFQEQIFPILFSLVSSQSVGSPQASMIDTTPPVIILDHDGKWKEYYEQIHDNEFNCYAMTCSVNLTAERSYDREGGALRYMWMYDMSDLTTSRDPGVRKFTRGDHDIWLRVIDQSGNWSEVHYTVHVLGQREKIEKIAVKKPKESKKKTIYTASISEPKKPVTSIRMEFFSPPEIDTQGKTQTGGEHTYICYSTKQSCQINLTLTGNTRSYTYSWELSDGTKMDGKNPKAWTLPLGTHTVTLRVYKKGETVEYYSQLYTLKAIQKKAVTKKKVKKSIKKKKIIPKKKSIDIIPEAHAMSISGEESRNMAAIPFLLGLTAYVYRKRKSFFPYV